MRDSGEGLIKVDNENVYVTSAAPLHNFPTHSYEAISKTTMPWDHVTATRDGLVNFFKKRSDVQETDKAVAQQMSVQVDKLL